MREPVGKQEGQGLSVTRPTAIWCTPRSMRYPPAILDEIRARLPVSEVVRKRVQMKKAGREWKGLSPFNQEEIAILLRE